MRELESTWPEEVGAFLLIAVLLSLGYVAVAGWDGYIAFLKGPAAGWVQAIGSIAAIRAAAWIAHADTRRLHREKLVIADVVSATVIDQLVMNFEEIRKANHNLETIFRIDGSIEKMASTQRLLEALQFPQTADLVALAIVPGECAESIGRAGSVNATVVEKIQVVVSQWPSDSEARRALAKELLRWSNHGARLLGEGIDALQDFYYRDDPTMLEIARAHRIGGRAFVKARPAASLKK